MSCADLSVIPATDRVCRLRSRAPDFQKLLRDGCSGISGASFSVPDAQQIRLWLDAVRSGTQKPVSRG